MTFERGRAYIATEPHGEKIVVAVTGRRGGRVTFARVNLLKCVGVREIEGRETAVLRCNNGRDYFVSAAVEADLQSAAEVMSILERAEVARRRGLFGL